MSEERGEICFPEGVSALVAEGMLSEEEWTILKTGGSEAEKLVAEKFLKNREARRELGKIERETDETSRQTVSIIRFDAFLGWCLSERFPGAVKHLCC